MSSKLITEYQIIGNFCIALIDLFLITMSCGYLRPIAVIVAIALVVSVVECSSKSPVPFCKSQKLYHQFPIVMNEILSADMSDVFSGYNLNITLTSNNSFTQISQKLTLVDKRSVYLPGLISHHVQHQGNGWGKEAFILAKTRGVTSLTYGHFDNDHSVPAINTTVVVSGDNNVKCFDAVFYYAYAVAIVDCILIDNSTSTDVLRNYFYYIDLVKGSVSKKVSNPMFADFKNVTKRKTMEYRNTDTGAQYFLRAYVESGVDADNTKNTYMEVWIATNPDDLQLHAVIDRTYLHLHSLSITDVKIYLEDIFLLDHHLGLYRLDILKNQQIAITGRYDKPGFTKFSVYSDDLENQVLLALANNHSIYEIEWHNTRNPVLVNKYSLMEDSKVSQLVINNDFVIVQAKSMGFDDSSNKDFEIDYTWIFTKGSRTYSHAYLVIDHNSSFVEIEFNRQTNQLLLADQQGLRLYQLQDARLKLFQRNESKLNTSQQVIITAVSWDYHAKENKTCEQKFTVFFVEPNNMSLWYTGIQPPQNYSFNYPGQVHLDLDDYAMGPLIHYDIVNTKSQQVPTHWVNKVNKTRLEMSKAPSPGDVTFFYTEVIPDKGKQKVIFFYQEGDNNTHVAECRHSWEAALINCTIVASYPHGSHTTYFTAASFNDEQGGQYYYVFVLQSSPYSLFVVNYENHQAIAMLTFPQGFEGKIGGISNSNGYLYVLFPYTKTINVYKLFQCGLNFECKLDFKISAETLKPFEIDYFAPQEIITDRAHPEVLFIRSLGEVLIVDIDNKDRVTVMDRIKSPATASTYYKVAVNKDNMVLVASPNIIQEYDLRLIYIKKQVTFTKNLPIYGYVIPPNSDIEFSDMNHMVFINARDPTDNKSTILIYRCDYPAVTTLYDQIKLDKFYSRPGFEIEVSGFSVDFLSIIAGNQFMVYRVFEKPSLVIKDAFFDFTFDIVYYNPIESKKSNDIAVSVVNYPVGFTPTALFNNTMNNFKVESHGNYTWNDRKWFQGHVLSYNYTCEECHRNNSQQHKVRLRQHVDEQRRLHVGGYDYIETFSGGISVFQDLFRWNLNGSVHSVHNLPDQKELQTCLKVASTYNDFFIVTACQQLGVGINLYVTSLVSFKGFTWGPYSSSTYNVRKLEICQDILMVVDTSAFPEHRYQEGAVHLYQLSLDSQTGQQLDELEIIDSNDFYGAHGWDEDVAYLGNAHLIYSPNTGAYRLYVTQVFNGFFVVDFTKKTQETQINIVSTEFLDMKQLLQKTGFHLPNDASFQAITRTGSKYNPHLDTENIVITTKGYHNFEVTLVWDDTGHLVSAAIDKVFYRYGYYETYNEVKASYGYLAIGYIIPPIYEYLTNYTRQVIAVYDTRDYEGESEKGYAERYMLGAYRLNHTFGAMYAFNTTFDYQSNGTRVGIVISEQHINFTYHASISRELTIEFKKDFKNQILTIIPFSDFAKFAFNVTLINPDNSDPGEFILIITIVVICVLVTSFFTVYVIVLVKRKRNMNENGEQRQSLLTEEQSQANRGTIDARLNDNLDQERRPINQVTGRIEQQPGSLKKENESESNSEQGSSESQQQESPPIASQAKQEAPETQIREAQLPKVEQEKQPQPQEPQVQQKKPEKQEPQNQEQPSEPAEEDKEAENKENLDDEKDQEGKGEESDKVQ